MERQTVDVLESVASLVRRLMLGLGLSVLSAALSAAPTDILPAGEVSPGMKGYGLSDLGDGRGVQRFDVEIVGLLKSYAPKQDLILARIINDEIGRPGVIAGMSGSPIYVNGRLIGALAYGWPFSREPICGITPIQSMLDIRKAPAGPPVPIGGGAPTAALVSAFRDGKFQEPFAQLLRAFHAEPATSGPAPLPLPVSLAGSIETRGVFRRLPEAAHWMVAPSGAATAAAPSAPGVPASTLEPGSAVAA